MSKPESVIRLLRANKAIFDLQSGLLLLGKAGTSSALLSLSRSLLSSVSSLLGYNGTPLRPQSGKISVQ